MNTQEVEDPKPEEKDITWKVIGLIVLIVVLLIFVGFITRCMLDFAYSRRHSNNHQR
jgi:hypothetical protein